MKLLLFVIAYAIASGQSVSYVADLTWPDARNPAGTQYKIFRAPGQCGATGQKLQQVATVTTKSYADTTVTPGLWCYQIVSTINGADGQASDLVPGSIPPFKVEGITFSFRIVATTP